MVTNLQSPGLPQAAIESQRIRLARAARTAALLVAGVLGTDAGPSGAFVTQAPDGELLAGVSCVAAATGGYDVSLRLVAGLVALQPLGERVRVAVSTAARIARIELGSVSVHFAEVAVVGGV